MSDEDKRRRLREIKDQLQEAIDAVLGEETDPRADDVALLVEALLCQAAYGAILSGVSQPDFMRCCRLIFESAVGSVRDLSDGLPS